jgi:hypothetical protein
VFIIQPLTAQKVLQSQEHNVGFEVDSVALGQRAPVFLDSPYHFINATCTRHDITNIMTESLNQPQKNLETSVKMSSNQWFVI